MNLAAIRGELGVRATAAAIQRADCDRVCKWLAVFRAVCKYETNGTPGLVAAACQMYDLGARDVTVVTNAQLASYLERPTVHVWFHIGNMPIQLADWHAMPPLARDKLCAHTPFRHPMLDDIVAKLKECIK